MDRDRQFDSSWPVVSVVGLLLAFVMVITPGGRQVFTELLSSVPYQGRVVTPIVPARPEVLVVSGNHQDQTTVAVALHARGYRVVATPKAALGRDMLRSHASQIGLVVVDPELPGAERMIGLARSLTPTAKLIRLGRNHSAAELTASLLSAT